MHTRAANAVNEGRHFFADCIKNFERDLPFVWQTKTDTRAGIECAIRKKSEIQNVIQYIEIESDQDNNILYEIEKFFKNTDYLRKPHIEWIGMILMQLDFFGKNRINGILL